MALTSGRCYRVVQRLYSASPACIVAGAVIARALPRVRVALANVGRHARVRSSATIRWAIVVAVTTIGRAEVGLTCVTIARIVAALVQVAAIGVTAIARTQIRLAARVCLRARVLPTHIIRTRA